MAKSNTNTTKTIVLSAVVTFVIAAVLGFLANRYASYLCQFEQPWQKLASGFVEFWQPMLANLIYFDMRGVPLLVGLGVFLIVWIIWLRYVAFVGNFRAGEESGSARWGTKREGVKFKDAKNSENNLIFTKNFGLALSREKFNPELDRNLNVMVIGGSGSGKTFNYVLPNIMQLNTNYFITDPKGTLLRDSGHMLAHNGYEIKSLNTINLSESMHYNPLAYVKTDTDILSFVNCFIMNTNGDGKASDPFWENSEKLLYTALIAFLRDWYPKEHYNLPKLLDLLAMAKVSEKDENFKSPLDLLFEQIETGKKYKRVSGSAAAAQADEALKGFASSRVPKNAKVNAKAAKTGWMYVSSKFKRNFDGVRPAKCGGLKPTQDFALLNYHQFKIAAGKTLKSIIISCNVRLAPIATQGVRELLEKDELEIDKLGDTNRRIVLFGILSDTDKTLSFLFAILMWQTIDQLCRRALTDFGGRLPRGVHFIFDEFANIGTIPQIEETIAVTRSRNIGISIILQSVAQLTSKYDKKAQTIIDCCDTTLFLGGKSNSTNKEIAEMIGKQTINQMTYGTTGTGLNASGSKNMQIQGRDLIDSAEIGKLSRTKAIVLIAGTNPLQDDKFNPQTHKRYSLIFDKHNKKAKYKQAFDFTHYLKQQTQKKKGRQK